MLANSSLLPGICAWKDETGRSRVTVHELEGRSRWNSRLFWGGERGVRHWITAAMRPVEAVLAVQIVRRIHAIQREERGGRKSTSQRKEKRERERRSTRSGGAAQNDEWPPTCLLSQRATVHFVGDVTG
ncbi:hypothetical protein GW17_00004073 [Ensete ventricosum]|nr:hypothetical protein GW17_00004073 [Ensete ventricosum]